MFRISEGKKGGHWQKVKLAGGVLLLLILTSVLGGCAWFAWLAPEPEPPAVIIPDTTQVVDEATEEQLVEVIDGGEVLVFAQPTAFLDRLQPGYVMVFDVTDKTPYGLLRKVEQVERVDDRVVVKTVQATLEDAIAQGVIELSKVLTPEHLAEAVALKPGVRMVAPQARVGPQLIDPPPQPFRAELENVMLPAGVTLSGYIEFSPRFDFRVEIRWFRLISVLSKLTVTTTAGIEVASMVNTEVEAEEDIKLLKFKPITLMVKWVPVVIIPVLYANVGVDGEVSVGVTAGITSDLRIAGGVRYDRYRGWNLIHYYDFDFTPNVRPVSVTRRATVKAFAGPALHFKLYGIRTVYGSAHGFLEFAKDLATIPVWRLYGGLQAGAGIRVEVLSRTFVDASWPDLLSRQWRIAESLPNQPPTATISLPPDGATFAQGASITFRGSATDPEDGALTSASSVWTSNIAGQIGTGWSFTRTLPVGAHTITLTATDSAGATGTALVAITVTAPPAPAGWVEGMVIDASTRSPIAGATVRVVGTTYSVITDVGGKYRLELPAGTYALSIEKTGYHSASFSNVVVRVGETNIVDAVLFIDSARTGDGIAAGIITNAFTGRAEGAVLLNFRSGLNTRQGAIVGNTTTDASGNYSVTLPTGYYTAEATKSGFVTAFFNLISIGGITTSNQNFSITPVVAGDAYRIVLTWGETPRDLDSHLTGPDTTGGRFHVWYANLTYRGGGTSADLDVDDITSFGPETITLVSPGPGIYRYSVHNFSDRTDSTSARLSNVSGAKVRLYRGATLLREFTVPPGQTGTIWTVFELENGNIRLVNTITFVNTDGSLVQGLSPRVRGKNRK